MADQHETASPELSNLDPAPVPAGPAPAVDVSTSVTEASPAPPPKPPRPLSPHSQAKATLVEAFPNVDEGVIEAVLVASGGNVEPAFHALLGMLALRVGCLTSIFRHD
jgi:CUE domain